MEDEWDEYPSRRLSQGWGPSHSAVCQSGRGTFLINADELQVSSGSDEDEPMEWRDQHSSILEQNRYMLESGLRSDCSFTVGPEDGETKVFPAHKYIVCRTSSVFEAMFHTGMAEAESGEVRVTDMEPAIFKLMLLYMYCDEVALTCGEEALALSYAAHKYQLTHLLNKCVEILCCNFETRLIWQTLELAELISQFELRNKCKQMIVFEPTECLSAEGFEEMDVSVLCEVLRHDHLNVTSEMTLVDAALRWALHHAQQEGLGELADGGIRQVLGPAFSLLRLLTLTPQEFATGPALENWLTSEEKSCIFTNIIAPGKSEVLAPLCSNMNKRIIPACEIERSCPENYQILNRPIFSIKHYFNRGNMNCFLSFSVDKDIWLRSITVVTQSNKSFEELGNVYPCDFCLLTEDIIHNSAGRGMGRGDNRVIPGHKVLVTDAVEADEELNQFCPSFGRGRLLMVRPGQGRPGAFPPSRGGPRVLEARPPANFFLAEQSPTKYPENIEMSLFKMNCTLDEHVHPIKNPLNIQFQYSKKYNTFNKLQFPKPILLQKSDNFFHGHFYLLKVSFLKAGYYEGGESVDHLRFGDVDFKFNAAGINCPMVNHGLIRSLEFSSEDS